MTPEEKLAYNAQLSREQHQAKQVRRQQERDRQIPSLQVQAWDSDRGAFRAVAADGTVRYVQPITNGAIAAGDTTRPGRNRIDGMPHKRRKPEPVEIPILTGSVKVLFSVIADGVRNFYVGGDRSTPTKIFEIPTSWFLGTATLSNTGRKKDDWIVSLRYLRSDATLFTFKTISGGQQFENTSIENRFLTNYLGAGVWTGGLEFQSAGIGTFVLTGETREPINDEVLTQSFSWSTSVERDGLISGSGSGAIAIDETRSEDEVTVHQSTFNANTLSFLWFKSLQRSSGTQFASCNFLAGSQGFVALGGPDPNDTGLSIRDIGITSFDFLNTSKPVYITPSQTKTHINQTQGGLNSWNSEYLTYIPLLVDVTGKIAIAQKLHLYQEGSGAPTNFPRIGNPAFYDPYRLPDDGWYIITADSETKLVAQPSLSPFQSNFVKNAIYICSPNISYLNKMGTQVVDVYQIQDSIVFSKSLEVKVFSLKIGESLYSLHSASYYPPK